MTSESGGHYAIRPLVLSSGSVVDELADSGYCSVEMRYLTADQVLARLRRQSRRLGQQQKLAVKLGVSPAYLSDILQGRRDPSTKILAAMGSCEKQYVGDFFRLAKKFGAITLIYHFYRDKVCTRRVVGTKVVPEEVIPAREAQVIPETVVEIVEWDCGEPLLKNRQDNSEARSAG